MRITNTRKHERVSFKVRKISRRISEAMGNILFIEIVAYTVREGDGYVEPWKTIRKYKSLKLLINLSNLVNLMYDLVNLILSVIRNNLLSIIS